MKVLKYFLASCLLLGIVYIFGPVPEPPIYTIDLPKVPNEPTELADYLNAYENRFGPFYPKAKAKIVWNDSLPKKTEYAVLYLHGFSATWYEGAPFHQNLADSLQANLLLARISGHGIQSSDELLTYTAQSAWESAKLAYTICTELGEKVVVVGTSTGATLGLMLAARFPVHALINISPNIKVNSLAAPLLNNPWGLQIARLTFGGTHRKVEADDSSKMHWHTFYRLESIVQMQQLLEDNMNKLTFGKITSPVYTACYYKNEEFQDPVVSVEAMREMHRQLGSPDSLKKIVSFPEAGDHVIVSSLKSNSHKEVLRDVLIFLSQH